MHAATVGGNGCRPVKRPASVAGDRERVCPCACATATVACPIGRSRRHGGQKNLALAPDATQITVQQVLAMLDADFEPMARAVAAGEFALWVGSGISRRAPNLGHLVSAAIEFLRERAVAPATAAIYTPPLEAALRLAGKDPDRKSVV